MPNEYLDLVRELYKAEGKLVPQKLMRAIHATLNAHDGPLLETTLNVLKRARVRFRRKLSVDMLTELLAQVHKSASDDVKAQLRAILDASFAGASAEFVAAETDLINELAAQFATAYDVKLNFDFVRTKAVEYLTEHAANYFTTLADAQAQGLLAQAGSVLASDSKYTIRDVAATIRDAFLNTSLYYPADKGSRSIGSSDWALLTARTETARAASFAQQSTLASIGAQTWQWQAEDSCCDDCSDNADDIVSIGDDFPSGDQQPPAHPNCRCVCTAVLSELDSISDEEAA